MGYIDEKFCFEKMGMSPPYLILKVFISKIKVNDECIEEIEIQDEERAVHNDYFIIRWVFFYYLRTFFRKASLHTTCVYKRNFCSRVIERKIKSKTYEAFGRCTEGITVFIFKSGSFDSFSGFEKSM